ncbi:short transient receptor potential channel 5-like [Saccoglossus kowalevskii]
MTSETSFIHRQDPELERIFLSAVEKGEKRAAIVALEHADYFNVNCEDAKGRTALVIAVQNGNIDILELLLNHRSISLGDALLRAVDMQFTPAVKAICNCLQKRHQTPEGLYCRALNGDFHADITPVVLAAHHNKYDILKLLLDLGARIELPELYNFQTEEFTLEHSVGTINVYRALASQAYISLTSEDPIETAFQLSYKLQKLSVRDYEFRFQYEQLSNQCAQYAADLLGHVRNTQEQIIVLNHSPEEWAVGGDFTEPLKVKKAIRYSQKKFISHPHCQQRLIERWYHGLPAWRKHNYVRALLLSLVIGVCFPLLAVCYVISPHARISQLLRVPYIRFVCHTASSIVFLFLLAIQSMDIHFLSGTDIKATDQHDEWDLNNIHTSASGILITCYILSTTVIEFKELWAKGARVVKDNVSWKMIDYFTLSLFWMWLALHVTSIFKDLSNTTGHINGDNTSNHIVSEVHLNTSTLHNDIDLAYGIHQTGHNLDQGNITSRGHANTTLSNDIKKYLDEAVARILLYQDITRDNITDVVELRMNEIEMNLLKVLQAKDFNERTPVESTHSRVRRAVTRISNQQLGGGSSLGGNRNMLGYNLSLHFLPTTHPILVADGLFAIAKVLSFLRLIRMTVVHLQIGPMQISLGRMMIDISKFFVIFCLVWFAFSVGLNQLYFHYAKKIRSICEADEFQQVCWQPYGSITDALSTLFWTLFGMSDLASLDVYGLDHWFTEAIGRLLYAAYHILAIVVLLNILIAMMSNTYTRIEEDADIQWKYSRSRLWMSFYEENSTLPPPFSLFPTLHCVKTMFAPGSKLCGGRERKKKKQTMIEKKDKEYKDVVHQLVQRYIFSMRRASGEDDSATIPDPWIIQLKQDVSGFKYDMFETLGNMDSRMKHIQHTVDDSASVESEKQIGNDVMRALEGAIEEAETTILPVRPQIFRNLANLEEEMKYMDEDLDRLEDTRRL